MEPPSPAKAKFGNHRRRGMLWRGVLITTVFFLGVAAPIVIMQAWMQQDAPKLGIGKPAPRIDLINLSSENALADANLSLEGKVTLLHFWGTWCGACRMEYPELAEATQTLAKNPRFTFVPVTCDYGAGETFEGLWQNTNSYFQSQKIVSAAYADPRGITRQSVAQRIERNQLWYPSSILIGPDGTIVGFWEGYSAGSVPEITKKVQSLLSSL